MSPSSSCPFLYQNVATAPPCSTCTSSVLCHSIIISHLASQLSFPLVFLPSYIPSALLPKFLFQNLDLTTLPLQKPSEKGKNLSHIWHLRCSKMVPKSTLQAQPIFLPCPLHLNNPELLLPRYLVSFFVFAYAGLSACNTIPQLPHINVFYIFFYNHIKYFSMQ